MRTNGRGVLFVLFAASGFAGLIYESIWTHYLKLFLGHAAYAQALVLAIFMGGLALGSWIAGRLSVRWCNLLRAYAVIEMAIGAAALVFHPLFTATVGFAYDSVLPALAGHPSSVSVFKWCLSALLILPQSVLLGMTFPLMTAGMIRSFPERPGRSIALLYFANSIGAAVGVLASGFVLVRALGLPGTVCLAGVLNLAVGEEVWRRFSTRTAHATSRAPVTEPRPTGGGARLDRALATYLLVSLATGASSFLYEVTWIRMLSLVLGASTHAFELMLSAFILGLALGGLWIQRRIDSASSPVTYLAIVQVAMGLLALATLPLYGTTFHGMRWLVETLPRTDGGYALFNVASNAIAIAVMLPATFCAGMTLPLVTYWLIRRGYGESSIGDVYAANTMGAILAVFFATHFGMQLLGVKGLLVLGAGVDLALGVGLAWAAARPRLRLLAGASVVSGLAITLTLTLVHLDPYRMASGVYRTGRLLDDDAEQVLFHRDGKTATVSVIANAAAGQLRISTNGKVDAAITLASGRPAQLDESTMILLAGIPMAIRPAARTAACIGFGSGLTTHTLLSNPRLDAVDTIEIEEEMIRGAALFRPRNELAYTDPRGRLHIDDAKSFFAAHGTRYDIIVSEPSNPWVSGVAGLFSTEFYRQARRQLTPDGIFVQWIQLYEIDPELVASVLKAIEANFGDYVVYAANDVDAIIVATNGAPLRDADPDALTAPALVAALRRAAVERADDLVVRKIGDRRSWRGLTGSFSVEPNSDFHPVLDQGAARARFLGVDSQALLVFGREPLPLLEMLSPPRAARSTTTVTRSSFLRGSIRAYDATVLRDLVTGVRAVQPVTGGGPEMAAQLLTWSRHCATESAAFPLQSLLSVAQASVSDLSPTELNAMWAQPLRDPCKSRLGTRDRRWVEFVSALSERDPTRIAASARALLDNEHALIPQTVRYLVAAGMLGSIADEDDAAAERLWSRYGGPIDIRGDLLLRTLVGRVRGASIPYR